MASAIQLALATFQKDAMRRILLISDGNQTAVIWKARCRGGFAECPDRRHAADL